MMQEIYEKVIESAPELKGMLMNRLRAQESFDVMTKFMDQFECDNTLDVMLIITMVQFLAGSAEMLSKFKGDIRVGHAREIIIKSLEQCKKDWESNEGVEK